ncbi:MAG: beta-ketoacyl-[acyl-carrier-protein] synthase family protein [Desulfobacterales bacterium]|jgi:3-oxoacyl-[acyl-carrier-protein] synthase II
MKANAPVIIGYDAVSPLGVDLEDQWQRALEGRSGVGPLTRFPYDKDFPVQIAGEIGAIDHLPYPFLSAREQARWPSPIFKYALLTVHRALERSGLVITPDMAPRVAVTFSSAVGGLDTLLASDRRWIAEGRLPMPWSNPNACINMVGGIVSMWTGAKGPISATITACATGVTSVIIGAMLLELGRADVAVCGAVDLALVEPIVAGFATMNGAYVPKEGAPPEPPERVSRPFSAGRRGFVISEGAGCIVIATPEFANAHGLACRSEVAGWSMTSDAHHFVSPYPETVTRCIAEAISDAGVSPDRIDAINAHATSTRIGDQVEVDALRSVFGGKLPPITANKSLTGHAMGASSAIEVVFALRGIEDQRLPPTINHTPDPELDIDCVAEGSRSVQQEYVLKNAFGFGGCNACIVFRKRG